MRARQPMTHRCCIMLFVALLCLGACSAPSVAPPATTQPAPAIAPPVATTSVVAPAAATTVATATAVATATTVAPTATAPRPGVVLRVAPQWETAAQQAIADLEASGPLLWGWTVVADPAAEATAEATPQPETVLLAHAPGELAVREEPIALAVPFTTNWESVTRADGDVIAGAGHSLAVAILWSEMEPTLKALRVEGLHPTDEGYPYKDSWSLVAAADTRSAAEALRPFLAAAMAPEPVVHLTAVGDVNLDRTLGIAIENGNLDYPFEFVAPVLQAADYTIGNLETALGTTGEPAAKRYPFRSPPGAAESLARAGFDLVSLANNHAMDYGPEALLEGMDLLHAQGVATVGAGVDNTAAHTPHFAEVNGLSIAFLGYVNVPIEAGTNFDTASWTATDTTPGLAWADPERIREDVAAVRPDVDLVVVMLHSGYEYIEEPGKEQIAAAQAATEAGADLVVGHHAHILQGIQYHDGGVIAYGLGNFAFNIDGPPETAVLNVWLDRNGVRQIEVRPAFVMEGGQPRLAEPWETAPILERVNFLTTLLNAGTTP